MNAGGDESWRRAQLSALGVSVQRQRRRLGWSQAEAAFRAGISLRTYRSLELAESATGGELDPRLSTVMAVLRALDLSDRILDAEEEAP